MKVSSLFVLFSLLAALSCSPGQEPLESEQEEPLPIIDMHLHAFPVEDYTPLPVETCPDPTDYLPAFDLHEKTRFELTSCAEPLLSATSDSELMERTLEELERYNIIAAVTSGPLESVRRWKQAGQERIIPGISLTSPTQKTGLADLRELMSSGEIQVLGEVTTQYRGFKPTDPSVEEYLALAEELDVPVGIHMGLGSPGAAYMGDPAYRATLSNPLLLEEVLIRHPKLRLYVMHAGWPMLDEMVHLLYSHPQVYVDIAVLNWHIPRNEFYSYLRRLVEAGFAKRIMFGSDQMVWPDSIALAIETTESVPFLTEQQKRDIFYNNAARFLRLEEDTESN